VFSGWLPPITLVREAQKISGSVARGAGAAAHGKADCIRRAWKWPANSSMIGDGRRAAPSGGHAARRRPSRRLCTSARFLQASTKAHSSTVDIGLQDPGPI